MLDDTVPWPTAFMYQYIMHIDTSATISLCFLSEDDPKFEHSILEPENLHMPLRVSKTRQNYHELFCIISQSISKTHQLINLSKHQELMKHPCQTFS